VAARPLGLGVRRVRGAANADDAWVDVELVVRRGSDVDEAEVALAMPHESLRWLWWNAFPPPRGVMQTRHVAHGATRDRCEWATTAHVPWCRCDECMDVPF
jgi:hypothetical protein